MREGRRSGVLSACGAVLLAASVAAGCFDSFQDCALSATCTPPGGDGGGGNPACEGDPTRDGGLVNDTCGVFVSASAEPGGDGTRVRPFRSFAEAAAKRPKRVYACAETYAESAGVAFARGVEIYAGYTECTGAWSWSAEARTSLMGPADAIALALSGGDHHVENLNVTAADATVPGGSSIGLLVAGGTLSMRSGDVTAGAGQAGADGESPAADEALSGAPGNPGSNACMGDLIEGNAGGAAVTTMCGAETSVGGKGGDGGNVQQSPLLVLAGGAGESGQPTTLLGQGGLGEPVSGTWSCGVGAEQGGANSGAPGMAGVPCAGASENALGALSSAGFTGATGEQGGTGSPGQGGGGGGGAKGGRICAGNTYGPGASGGSGGAGGCGGRGGGGGNGGGASIAVVSLGASVTFEKVTLTAGSGGKGGNGGAGQPGGSGGSGGAGGQRAGTSNPGCAGGQGGLGGNGGPGGGGRGGPSIGIAYTGAMPQGAIITPGTPGEGGDGGPGNETAGRGAPGLPVEAQAFE